jgi:hypothetical protein
MRRLIYFIFAALLFVTLPFRAAVAGPGPSNEEAADIALGALAQAGSLIGSI